MTLIFHLLENNKSQAITLSLSTRFQGMFIYLFIGPLQAGEFLKKIQKRNSNNINNL